MKSFNIHGIEVRIYKNRSSLRRRIRNVGHKSDHTECMVIPVEYFKFENGRHVKSNELIGEMYLHERVPMPVLVHETLHAATTIIRKSKKSLDLGRSIYKNEERLAYTQTMVLQEVLNHIFPRHNSEYNFQDIEWWVNAPYKRKNK